MPERIYYLRNEQKVVFNPTNGQYSLARGEPIICLISARDKESGKIKYGYSILSPHEDLANFSKAEGRVEANKKLAETPLEVETAANTGHEINKSIIRHFSETIGKKNGQVRKLTRRWLKVSAAKTKAAEVKEKPLS